MIQDTTIIFIALFCFGALCVILLTALLLKQHRQLSERKIRERIETELERRTAQLRDALKQAEQATEAKSLFLAAMSHEIRSPVNAIVSMNDLMPRDNFSELQKRYFQDTQKIANSLLGIINDILDFSEIEAGKMRLSPAPFNLRALFDGLVSRYTRIARAKSLRFKAVFAPDTPETIFGDETRVRQALTKVIDNAIQYTKSGSVTFTLSGTDPISAEVKDSGAGIREEDLPKIFGVFQQFNNEDAAAASGIASAGLGLAITKRLLDLMGGSIEAESVYGSGSTFTISFPASMGDPEEAARAADAAGFVKAKPGAELNVLVVDDAALNLSVALGFLAKHDISAEAAASGAEAIAKVTAKAREGKSYDLIFMDHMMPDMDGVDTTWRIRAFEAESCMPRTPIVALTANVVPGMKEYSLSQGMDDFITKPIEAAELNRMLAAWMPAEKIALARDAAAQNAAAAKALQSDPLYRALSEAGCDVEAALSHTGGDLAFLADCVRRFNKDIDGYIAEMRRALGDNNLDAYSIPTHTVKGILATLGVDALAARARLLEDAAKAGDAVVCGEGSEGAIEAFLALRRRLEAALGGEAPAGKKAAGGAPAAPKRDLSFVAEKLAALRKAARARRQDDAEALAQELDGAALAGAGAGKAALWKKGWPRVKEALDRFALAEVVREADALLEGLAPDK
ncbi:MAG: response regulator [Treponema sp.]|jgi:signal transduction histidine kinase/DNA-binding response OmpR family regulator|nr:response regulator [Treponema sp.]